MNLMTNDHEAHCQHGNLVLPTDADGSQRLIIETVIERSGRAPYRDQFINQGVDRSYIRARVGDEPILIETLRNGLVIPREEEHSVTHDPFDVGKVLDDLLHRPLARRISPSVERR